MRIVRTLAVAITVAAVAATAQQAAAAQSATSGAQPIDGAYIVSLQRGADAGGLARALQISPRYTYQAALNGFAADLTASQLRALRGNPAVVRIEPDASVENALDETQTNPPPGVSIGSTSGGFRSTTDTPTASTAVACTPT